jgi:hypothetical protein
MNRLIIILSFVCILANASKTKIRVKTLLGKIITLNVDLLKDTIHTVKEDIERKEGFPANKHMIYFNAKLLKDNLTLKSCGIENENILYIMPRLMSDTEKAQLNTEVKTEVKIKDNIKEDTNHSKSNSEVKTVIKNNKEDNNHSEFTHKDKNKEDRLSSNPKSTSNDKNQERQWFRKENEKHFCDRTPCGCIRCSHLVFCNKKRERR